jgi:hypothetical protein
MSPGRRERIIERQTFINSIMTQFGFERDVAVIMWQVWLGINANNPNATQQEIYWEFTRALSQLRYNRGNILANQWRAGAGYVYGYNIELEQKYFTNLGLTVAQYNLLRYKVRIQNDIVGNPHNFTPERLDDLRINNSDRYNDWKVHMETALAED